MDYIIFWIRPTKFTLQYPFFLCFYPKIRPRHAAYYNSLYGSNLFGLYFSF